MSENTQLVPVRQAALLPVDERPVASWDEMIGAFLDTLNTRATRRTYAPTIEALPDELGGRGPGDVNARQLAAWRQALLDRMKAGEMAPNTARRQLMAARSFFKFAHLVGQSAVSKDLRAYVLGAPAERVVRPFVTLSESDEARLLGELSGEHKGLVAVMLFAGLRVSEACALQHGDYYTDSERRHWLKVRAGKGDKSRDVPVNAALARILGEPTPGDDPLFPSRQMTAGGDRHYTRARAWQILRAALDRAFEKRRRISPHSLRHTAAMRWLRAGVPLTVIKDWLGHSKLDTTEKYLKHLKDEEQHAWMV